MSAHALRYRVSVPHPERHLAEIELELELGADTGTDRGSPVQLEMAAWCPGSYLIRDYARYLRDLEAIDPDTGAALAVTQVSKRAWEVAPAGASRLLVRYQVYGHELTVRTNHIDETHAFLHPPALFLYPAAAREAVACEVVVDPPAARDWPVVTALEPARPGQAAAVHHFRAPDIDALLDAPIHLGPVEEACFTAGGRPVRLAVWGRRQLDAPFDLDSLAADMTRVIDTHAAPLGGLPCDRYTFVLMLSPGAYGGLEHGASSANLNSPTAFASGKSYYELVELLSHELFHAWNGKRILPRAFQPFDYGRENYTRCLWQIEGMTSYYDRLVPRRAQVVPVAHYLGKLCDEWGRLQAIPGRRRHSLEDASFNSWVKLYKPDESNLNTTVSYYLKGGLVMTVLDLEIRRLSGGEVSLDQVLIHLWRHFGAVGQGYPEDLQPVYEAATGLDLGAFFSRYIRGREDPDLGAALATCGLAIQPGWDGYKPDDGARPPVWLGATLARGGRARISGVLDGGPADAAGLSPGDEIIAVDRDRITGEGDLRQRLTGRSAGQRISLALFRRGRLTEVELEPCQAPPTRYEISASAEAGSAERQRFRDWLAQDYPEPGVVASASVTGAV